MCKFPYLALTRLNSHYLTQTLTTAKWIPNSMGTICLTKLQTGLTGKSGPPEMWISFFKTFPVGPNRSIDFCNQITRNIGEWIVRSNSSHSQGNFTINPQREDNKK